MFPVAWAPPAGAGELGDRIAEQLCYPPSARTMQLRDADLTLYRTTGRLDGDYRDIQGAEARAWFAKTPDGALCQTPAGSDLTLYFCAEVERSGAWLHRHPRRLCPQ